MSHIPFPSIESFRHVVSFVRKNCDYHGRGYPTISFVGRVKLHGTNAGVRLNPDGTLTAQSRERDLSLLSDNAGFAAFVERNKEELTRAMEFGPFKVLYGEWIGRGIQKNVAITQLEKRFVPFAIAREDEYGAIVYESYPMSELVDFGWLERVDHLLPEPKVTVDFANPEASIETFESLTAQFEDECPYGKMRGVSGIGEGLVWTPFESHNFEYTRLCFKTKGEKHGNKGRDAKVKIAVSVEKIADMALLIEKLLPQWRLEQGISVLKERGIEISKSTTGDYLKWIASDVIKEEADTVANSGFDTKVVMGEVSKVARRFYFSQEGV